jgi:hypothetical protein
VFFLILSILHLPECMIDLETTQRSRKLNFTVLERRDGVSCADFPCLSAGEISSFGVMLKGIDFGGQHDIEYYQSTATLTFRSMVEWDSWYFITSAGLNAKNDPVKFSLHSYDGQLWKQVGSSSSVRTGRTTLFFNGKFETSTVREYRHEFALLCTSFGGFTVVVWLGAIHMFGMGLCGYLGQERLGAFLPSLADFVDCVILVITAIYAFPETEKGNFTSYYFLYVGLMMGCASAFTAAQQLLSTCLFFGCCQATWHFFTACYLPPDTAPPWAVTISLLCTAPAVVCKIYQRWTVYHARHAIGADWQIYDTLWKREAGEPGAGEARAELEALLSSGRWNDAASQAAARQSDPSEATARFSLCFSKGYKVLFEHLSTLYTQAAAAQEPLRERVLALAARSGGLLPGRPSLGFCRLPSSGAGVDYAPVTACTTMEDVQWVGLKRRERALEKVRILFFPLMLTAFCAAKLSLQSLHSR